MPAVRAAVVGPVAAGKTTYLASLLRAAIAGGAPTAARPINARPSATSRETVRLHDQAEGILCGIAFGATREVTRYEVKVDLPGARMLGLGRFDLGRAELQVTMVDAPGGGCMPAPGVAVHPEVVDALRAAHVLLVVVPADSTARPSDIAVRLRHVAASTRARPFERVAVVLTMAELLVADHGGGALRALDALDPRAEIARLCGDPFVAAVSALAPHGGDWYSLVSAYGFDARTGKIAAERTAGGWRVKPSADGFLDTWRPYRLFEPLEFLGRGVCWREAV